MMVSFVLSFFPRDVLDEILNLIGSVSEGFPSYSIYKSNYGYPILSCIMSYEIPKIVFKFFFFKFTDKISQQLYKISKLINMIFNIICRIQNEDILYHLLEIL